MLDKQLQEKALNNSSYSLDTFSGGGKKHLLICKDKKICIPEQLQKCM